MSTVSSGNYYKQRTKKYLENLGYFVVLTEFTSCRPIGGGKMIWTKKDVCGADGIAMNGSEIIFWNAKSTTKEREQGVNKHKWQGRSEFKKYPFPLSVKLHLYIWLPREQPIIVDCHA